MPSPPIPLFPLHAVVFPRTSLPLHIFEERYKEMVGDAIRDGSEFGIVLAKEEGIANAGCTVTVEKVFQMYPDGRMDILTRGKRRFEVMALNEEKSYLQADVTYFDDDDLDPVPEELRSESIRLYEDLKALLGPSEHGDPDVQDRQLSFQLAQRLPDLDFLGAMLRLRSETSRLRELNQYLGVYIPRQQAIERMKTIAPTNGSGMRPAGL